MLLPFHSSVFIIVIIIYIKNNFVSISIQRFCCVPFVVDQDITIHNHITYYFLFVSLNFLHPINGKIIISYMMQFALLAIFQFQLTYT